MSKARYKLEAIRLLPTISSYKSENYAKITKIYELVKNHKVGCTPCMYYSVLNYFKAIEAKIAKYKGRKKLKPIKR